ncbi:MAG: hypothetical protein GF317_14400 [Candidatus Lokiarchaeota archaeon]|nr:hypothetical protein [Candidatus Lokiarchaeota archaeon]MBD3200797.1 hypothetical protein [Candidatus Lokiarchaeota archaeon]
MSKNTREFLAENQGKIVEIEGTVSNIMRQHIQIHKETHSYSQYIDLEDGYQTITYTKDEINCEGAIKIKGIVIEVTGSPDPRSKVSEDYAEYHIIANSWKCIENQ